MRAQLLLLAASLAPALAAPAVAGPAEAFAVSVPGEVSGQPWWLSFDDPGLDEVIEATLAGNHDLEAAVARMRQARDLSRQAAGALAPQVSFDVAAQVAPTDSRGFAFGGFPSVPGQEEPPDTYTTGSAMFKAALPLDLFGRQTTSWQASRHEALASAGDRDALALALSTQAAEAWFDLRLALARQAVVQEQVRTSGEALELVELRYQTGQATALDVLQQRQQLASVKTLVPQADNLVRLRRQQLNLLMGRPADAALPPTAGVLPALPPAPPTGRPEDLLHNRPDLAAAALRVDAARYKATSTALGLAPSVTLTGQVGWQAYYETEWLDQDTWGAGAALSVPLFGGGRALAALDGARAARMAADSSLSKALLVATTEVEDALARERALSDQLAAQQIQHDAAVEQLDQSRLQYVSGLSPYINVLSAMAVEQQARLALLQTRRDVLSARIQLHDALGGAWVSDLSASRGVR